MNYFNKENLMKARSKKLLELDNDEHASKSYKIYVYILFFSPPPLADFKTVLKCPLTEAKLSYRLLKLIFNKNT